MTSAALPLVLLPGLSCDRAAWQPVIECLPDRDCIVPELPACDHLGAMADELLAALPAGFALAGHSMGGRIALEMLRRVPDRIDRVALLDTGFGPLPSGEAGVAERSLRQGWLDLARADGMRALARHWAPPMVHPDRRADAALMDAIYAMIARSNPERFAHELAALLARPDASAVLAAIRCPTLVACGREDGWSAVPQHQEMAARIPGSRLVVFEHCGHMAPMERPQDVAAALRDWLHEPPAVAAAQAQSQTQSQTQTQTQSQSP